MRDSEKDAKNCTVLILLTESVLLVIFIYSGDNQLNTIKVVSIIYNIVLRQSKY